jgi:hypothetical protein
MRALLIVLITCTVHVASAERFEEPGAGGFFVAAGAGLNVGHPFGEVQVGRRFRHAPHFELYLDYSYDAKISEYAFQTFGLGGRTYLATIAHCELFHQALASFAISQGGDLRTIGDRLLGGFFTQGLGLALVTGSAWTIEVAVSTGYPVWLRSDVALVVRF